MTLPGRLATDDHVLDIVTRLEAAGHETWCVGGAVRDRLLDPTTSGVDVDLATAARPEQVQALFRRTVAVGIAHGTVGIPVRGRRLVEVTTFRRDVETDGRHAVVKFGETIDEDLARRDFTINAIAYHPIRHEWRDPFHGADDLTRRVVRAVGDPAQRFREDYLRILRALRYSARFDFQIDRTTWSAAREGADGLRHLSAERVRDEWYKGLMTARSPAMFASLWWQAGAAAVWIPELTSGEPRAGVVPSDRDHDRDPVVLTVWLTSDPVAVLTRLKASNADLARAAAMVSGPSQPTGQHDAAVRRWLARTGRSADDHLALARLRDGGEPAWASLVVAIRARGDPIVRGDLAVDGRDLAALGLAGPRLGETLAMLLERVHDDPALNARETLLTLAREQA